MAEDHPLLPNRAMEIEQTESGGEAAAATKKKKAKPARVASLDVFRGVCVLVKAFRCLILNEFRKK